MDSIWNNPVMVDRLVSLYNEGKSAGQIAKIIGLGITRNSVLSKTKRLKRDTPELFTRPTNPVGRNVVANDREPIVRQVPKPQLAIVKLADAPEPIGAMNDVPNKQYGTCHYPHGNPGEGDWRYCGHPSKENSSYCGFHHDLCRTPFREGARISDEDKKRMAIITHSTGAHRVFG